MSGTEESAGLMDYSRYEIYDFDNSSAFNMSTGYKERSYQISGFQSIPSFNRVFHHEKGMAPGEYRALFIEDRKPGQGL